MRRALCLGLVVLCVGCTTAAKQAYYTATGPQGGCLVVSSEGGAPLAAYNSIEVARFGNDLPGIIDDSLISTVQTSIVSELKEKGLFLEAKGVPSFQQGKAAQPTAVIRGRLIDIVTDRIPGQKLIGGGDHLIAAVEIVDKESGKVLAKANLRGVVKSALEGGDDDLAKGMARGAKKLCEKLGKKEVK